MKVASRPLLIFAIVLAAIFIALGFWQLGRLSERRAVNASLASRAAAASVPIARLPTDTANAHYRRISVAGAYDYANETILTLRSRDGSPGVNIVTPARLPANDTALLVVRGWVYSPDGKTVDLTRWREG
ncbi:MAG TPA: SURF1 family cytochrome oxidase biogenesis protein, partial [Rhodothermia bacterium]|nr:SURF1 family cytochrome oxidase biogenesis protein [Rhodothermia bacterium]